MGVLITGVSPGSYAEQCGISAGDTLISVNGRKISDVLDYRYYVPDSDIRLEIIKKDGSVEIADVRKEEYEDIGLDFKTYLMDEKHSCRNHCVFCFIDQLPKGLRKSLYFKDDDDRLSFLMGNYITLTNLTQREVSRIIEMHISPVNVSVHTTDPALRVKMMRNKNAGSSLQILKKLAAAGTKLNCQLVLCRGMNDGRELMKTLLDLGGMYPSVQSIAAVPVGLSRYRNGLYPLVPYDRESSGEVLRIIDGFGSAFLKKHGTRLAFAADEFYLKAGVKVPDEAFYEDLDQLENGVGLIASLRSGFYKALLEFGGCRLPKPRKKIVATGVAAKPLIEELARRAEEKAVGLEISVHAIENRFFGTNINVSGLVTGQDLVAQLKGTDLSGGLLIPAAMLRSEGDMFLDSMTLRQAEEMLGVEITPVPNDGRRLLSEMTGFPA